MGTDGRRKRFVLIAAGLAAGLILKGMVVGAGAFSAGEPLTAQQVLDRVRANATSIESLQATVEVQTFEDGEVRLTQTMHLALLQPDKMRQEYLSPDYLAGNITLIVAERMWIYIAAAETWYSKDLGDLSDAEQPWLLFRQLLSNVEDEWDNYAFQRAESDGPEIHLKGVPATSDTTYGGVELWIDPNTFVPTRRLLYDVNGVLLVDVRIVDVVAAGDGVYLATAVETMDEAGELRNAIRYTQWKVDEEIDTAMFSPPEDANHE